MNGRFVNGPDRRFTGSAPAGGAGRRGIYSTGHMKNLWFRQERPNRIHGRRDQAEAEEGFRADFRVGGAG
ncbi:hypothetical protein BRAO375_280010 [Bradyrhizobium sp. ORS 375]|nr:hypothetical protein BRAO375_280010 [Bradyrhizobium sp. ORS 375]